MAPFISVIILAAGSSSRFGRPKLLMPLGKTSILEHTIDNVLSSRINEVIVVLGHHAEEITELLKSLPVNVVVNRAYSEGMSTSIVAGLGLVSDKAQGIMLVLADQPFVDNLTINHILKTFYSSHKGIVVPVHQDRRGHPVIFSAKYKRELLMLKGDIGGREVIDRHSDDILEVPVECKGVIMDIDTMESYNFALGQFKLNHYRRSR